MRALRFIGSLWRHHGTKIMGWLVAILGAMTAFKDRFAAIWWSDRGDQIYFLIMDVASYLLIGAGAVIIRRGYSNSRREGEQPFIPGESQL